MLDFHPHLWPISTAIGMVGAGVGNSVEDVTGSATYGLSDGGLGNVRFSGGVTVGQAIPLVFRKARLTSTKLQLALDGRVAADGRTTVAGSGRHVDYGAFTVEANVAKDGPHAVLVFASPLPAAGLKDVRVAIEPTPDGFTIDTTNTSKTILTLTRTATISHLLAILDGLPQAEGTHWLNTQPDLHHITLDDSTTGWATNRTDDTDTGVCYDTSTHNWQIC